MARPGCWRCACPARPGRAVIDVQVGRRGYPARATPRTHSTRCSQRRVDVSGPFPVGQVGGERWSSWPGPALAARTRPRRSRSTSASVDHEREHHRQHRAQVDLGREVGLQAFLDTAQLESVPPRIEAIVTSPSRVTAATHPGHDEGGPPGGSSTRHSRERGVEQRQRRLVHLRRHGRTRPRCCGTG